MTLNLRLLNLYTWGRKSETAALSDAARAPRPRGPERPCASAEDFGMRAAADAWLFACNQRTFR